MSGNLAVTGSLQDRLVERLRTDIGQLMTDEELSKIVTQSIHKIFFEPRVVSSGGYSSKTEPPIVQELIKQLLEKRVKDEVELWMKDNDQLIKDSIKDIIQEGAGAAVLRAFNGTFNGALFSLQHNIENALNNLRRG